MLVSGVVAGTLLGLLIGRNWRRLERIEIAWLPLLIAALVLRITAGVFSPGSIALYVASIAITGLVAAINWRLPGALLIALGSALNLAVIAANGAMPIDQAALESVGGRMPQDALHEPLTAQSSFATLADVILVAPLRAAYSLGDVAIALGGLLLPFVTLIRR